MLGLLYAAEDQPGSPDVVVLSHGCAATIGAIRDRRPDDSPHGALTPWIGAHAGGFMLLRFSAFACRHDISSRGRLRLPPNRWPATATRRPSLFVLGRLNPGRSVNQSQAEASSIAPRAGIDYRVDDFGLDFTVVRSRRKFATAHVLLPLLLRALVLSSAAPTPRTCCWPIR